MSLLVFGHKNPDTDSICSSISLSYLKNQLGIDAKPYALGEVRKEAQFVLDYFKVDAPEVLSTSVKGLDVVLVDHNEYAQSADDIKDANIVEIVDHHKIGGIATDVPISFRVMPVGCSCTVIYNMFKENNVEIPYHIAGLLLSAILSDTLLFKSPTTTDKDKEACEVLSKIANVNMEEYAMEMFKAGTSLDEFSIEEIVNMDFKEFNMSEKRVGIGQVFTLDIDSILAKKDDFLAYINASEYDMLVLALTDIIKEGSYLIYKADDSIISDAFNIKAHQGVFSEGVVSRKKQLVPNLTQAIKATV
ncbi:manganese-dependent inorganic pyrophosphatase [Clostridium sp. CCUG 7971]|uniref:manganese-dependent inorganic pyrophosphatase n=1 Tax=Clostridium sp. CCUG 7971 TaxID=2811414 RepID=UPI001ABA94E4|nr:manganese-dependent inorganic pyrophosphatase [Clostridium sp. CCUG 7971]MBO3444443.1 manganese-dependent inorganic pyrophosphatase [Clostridium sp. CCUG 7971]